MLGWTGAVIELVCGFLIAFGFLTRLAAFIAAGEMAVAYFMVHAPNHLFPIVNKGVNKGESAVFYCWFFFFAIFYGPGRWSIDALFKNSPDRDRAVTQAPATP
jgi:putative oxidoreductase